MYQSIICIGRLGTDPIEQYSTDGTMSAFFSMCVEKTYYINDEQKKSLTWFNVYAYGTPAKNAIKYLSKGRIVAVQGEIMSDAFGNPRVVEEIAIGKRIPKHEIRAEKLIFMDYKDKKEETFIDPKSQFPAIQQKGFDID